MTSPESPKKKLIHFFSLTRMHLDSQGNLRTTTSPMAIEQWKAYLEVFDTLVIHARIDRSSVRDEGYLLNEPRIQIKSLPNYTGLTGYLFSYISIRRHLKEAIVDPNDFYAMWVPSQISSLVKNYVNELKAPLLVVVIGDTEEVAKSIFPFPLGAFIGKLNKFRTRKVVRSAQAVSYVTLRALQQKYPAKPQALTLARSDVRLHDVEYRKSARDYENSQAKSSWSVIAVGSQQQNYKGHDLLLTAMSELEKCGLHVRLTLVGRGVQHDDLKKMARDLNLTNVNFVKSLGSSDDVMREICKHDMFVMPSRTEGMPKALLEAMSVGILCLGSKVGGIPEVLDSECLFEAESSSEIAERIHYFAKNPDSLLSALQRQAKFIESYRFNHTGDRVLKDFLESWVNSK